MSVHEWAILPLELKYLPVVGTYYRPSDAQRIALQATACTPCMLVPEPTNKHDRNAIQVMLYSSSKWILVGYVQRHQAEALAEHLPDATMRLVASWTRVHSSNASVIVFGSILASETDNFAKLCLTGKINLTEIAHNLSPTR